LYDLSEKKNIIAYNEQLLFTPASNVKLLTYLTCLNILEDTITSFKYKSEHDTLFIIPQGDPSFLNDEIDIEQLGFKFIIAQNKNIQIIKNTLHSINALGLGSGWAWEDSQYGFQSPMSFFPLYGNRVRFTNEENSFYPNINPTYFRSKVIIGDSIHTFIKRNENKNIFYINDRLIPKSYTIDRPFIPSDLLTISLLRDTIKLPIGIRENHNILTDEWLSFKSLPTDSLYKKMLFESDNHVSEQLLLMCSNTRLGYMNSEDIISYSKDSILHTDNHDIKWVDGSGLSRYNLVSPNIFIDVLKNIYIKAGMTKIKDLFPVGGDGDTLPSVFHQEDNWIYAKTGTLNNNFSLSGYIITDNKKVLAFSFLNNHYTTSKQEVTASIYKLLKFIKNNY